MNTYFYYKVIRKTIVQFLDVFKDINIARYDVNGNEIKRVNVPIKFGPKSKAYLFVREQQRNEEMLPMISINLQGMSYDPSRMGAKHENIKISTSITDIEPNFYKNVIPYNLEFNLTIWALHMVDIDQIFEQILPYFSPHIFIRINIPELDTTMDVKTILESCTPEMTDDVGEEEARVLKWACTFTVQTWLFKPLLLSDNNNNLINHIFTNFYLNEEVFEDRNTESVITSTGSIPAYTFSPTTSGAPSETQVLVGLGYDNDARLLFEYEVF